MLREKGHFTGAGAHHKIEQLLDWDSKGNPVHNSLQDHQL